MFQAVLFRKLDESLFAKQEFEDILTSDVFGALKYLPAEYLHAWIAKLRDRHPLLTPAFKLAQGFPEVEFWPQLHAAKESGQICEPDVVLWWEQLAVVIEAKRAGNFDVAQLQVERESTQHAAMARGLATPVIVIAVGRNRPAWWSRQRQATKHWLAFSTWGTLADVFLATLSVRQAAGSQLQEVALVRDLLARLDMRDIQPFCGFRSLAVSRLPLSQNGLPFAIKRWARVFPLRILAPEVTVRQVWSRTERDRSTVAHLAKSAPICRANHLLASKVSHRKSRVSQYFQMSLAISHPVAAIWPLTLDGSCSAQRGILAWRKAPEHSLAESWGPIGCRGFSIRLRGTPTTEASRLFWTRH